MNIKSSQITDLINWLNSLRSVTDFEMPALSKIQEVCIANGINAMYCDGGLLIGNPQSKIVFMAHVDRIGFVAIGGNLEDGSTIDVSYIAKPASVTPKLIKERFSEALLIGYDPVTAEDLFIASLLQNKEDNYQAKICRVINPHQLNVSYSNPIPLTAVKPALFRIDDYLQGNFDNSGGLAIALMAVAKYPEQLSCIITVAEEGGGYQNWPTGGRGALKYIQHHDFEKILVAVDVRPSSLIKSNEQDTRVGKGVVLREAEFRKDSTNNSRLILKADKPALDYVKKFALQNNIQYQTFSGLGITEAGRAYESLREGITLRCIWLQPPIANEHSPFEVVSLTDIENTLRIAEELRFL